MTGKQIRFEVVRKARLGLTKPVSHLSHAREVTGGFFGEIP